MIFCFYRRCDRYNILNYFKHKGIQLIKYIYELNRLNIFSKNPGKQISQPIIYIFFFGI